MTRGAERHVPACWPPGKQCTGARVWLWSHQQVTEGEEGDIEPNANSSYFGFQQANMTCGRVCVQKGKA